MPKLSSAISYKVKQKRLQRVIDVIEIFIQHGTQNINEAFKHYEGREGIRPIVQELRDMGLMRIVTTTTEIPSGRNRIIPAKFELINKTDAYGYASQLQDEIDELTDRIHAFEMSLENEV